MVRHLWTDQIQDSSDIEGANDEIHCNLPEDYPGEGNKRPLQKDSYKMSNRVSIYM